MATVTPINGNSTKASGAAEIGKELGVGPIMPGTLWNDWVGEDLLLANKPLVSLEKIIDMRRRDGQAKALTQLVTLPIRIALMGGEWIEPEEGDAEAETEFANLMWTLPPMGGGMTTPRSKLIKQILLSVIDGFAPFEIVRQIPQDGPLKGKVTLRKLAYRDPRTVKFNLDEHGGYKGFTQRTTNGAGKPVDVKLKPQKTVIFTHHDEMNPFYGVSLFEAAYSHYDAKRKLYYIAHLASQFAAVPGRLGKIPANPKASELASFITALRDFAFNTAMVVPQGYEVVPFNSNSGYDFLKLIDHHNSQMSKSILASFFDSEQRPVLIDRSQDTSVDLFLSCMTAMADDIADTLTVHLMPQFIDFNFNTKKYPVFRPGQLSDASKAMIADVFKTVVTAGILNCTPELVRETEIKMADQMGLDIDYEEIKRNEEAAAQQKAEAEAAQAEAQAAAEAEAAQAEAGGGGGPAGGSGGPSGGSGGGPGGAPGGGGPSGGAPAPQEVAAMSSQIDALVLKAQELFGAVDLTPEPVVPVDAGL